MNVNLKPALPRLLGALVLIGIATVPVLLRSGYLCSAGMQIGIHAIIAVGLGLLMGYAGQISLGHAAFYGLGAYCTAILTTRLHVPPLPAAIAGMVLTGAIAYAVGSPALRLHGHYLAMFTLGLGIIARIVFEQAESITNGFDGISGIPAFDLWIVRFDSDPEKYGLVVAVLALSVVVARNLVRSRVGRALRALHGSEDAARACGIDVGRAKLEVFVLSAMLASVAGSLYAHAIGFVSPEPFGFHLSVELVVMIVVGGAGSVWGPIAGAALFTVLDQGLQKVGERVPIVASLDTVLFGLVLILVVIFWEKGLVSLRLPPLFRRARPTQEGGA